MFMLDTLANMAASMAINQAKTSLGGGNSYQVIEINHIEDRCQHSIEVAKTDIAIVIGNVQNLYCEKCGKKLHNIQLVGYK